MDMLDRAFDDGLDPLDIRLELSKGFTDDFGTRTAFSANHTAAFIFHSGNRPFSANVTDSTHRNTLMSLS